MLNVGGFPLAACFLMRLYPAQELSENVKIFHVRLMAQKLKLLAWGGGGYKYFYHGLKTVIADNK
jgi:hypothetical protein